MFLIRIWLVTLLFSALLSPAWALSSDHNKPIDIKADRVEVNQRKQISHYIGNVRLVQGSMKIEANDVVVYMAHGKLDKIMITGNPAHFQQQPQNHEGLVTSTAQNMEYYAQQQRLLLKHNAEVNQGNNHFRGEFIEYDTRTSTVKANRGANSNARVHAIIQPSGSKANQSSSPADKTKPKSSNPAGKAPSGNP